MVDKFKPISISLSPNVQKDDVVLALKLLFAPWNWKQGDAIKKLEDEFAKYLGVKYAFSFNSGRSSLYAILKALELEKATAVGGVPSEGGRTCYLKDNRRKPGSFLLIHAVGQPGIQDVFFETPLPADLRRRNFTLLQQAIDRHEMESKIFRRFLGRHDLGSLPLGILMLLNRFFCLFHSSSPCLLLLFSSLL